MKNIIGLDKELDNLLGFGRDVAHEYYRQGVKAVLRTAVLVTRHSSSNAAFNWRVMPAGGTGIYIDYHGKDPVGQAFEGRSAAGDEGAIQSVAAIAAERENDKTIKSLKLEPVSIVNSIDDLGIRNYTQASQVQEVETIIDSAAQQLEREALEGLRRTEAGKHIES